MKLSFIDNENLIPLISLSDNYRILFVGLFGHCWDQFRSILIVEILKQEQRFQSKQYSIVHRGFFYNIDNLHIIDSVMLPIYLPTDRLSLLIPFRLSLFLLNNCLFQKFFLTIWLTFIHTKPLCLSYWFYFPLKPRFRKI